VKTEKYKVDTNSRRKNTKSSWKGDTKWKGSHKVRSILHAYLFTILAQKQVKIIRTGYVESYNVDTHYKTTQNISKI
jgi:hypothetical protein